MADGTIQLDDREIPFSKGDTIIQAAYKAGVDIPHYCWHPGLSAPANCRMCLVEVGPPPGRPPMMLDILKWDAELKDYVPARKPKLFPACQMRCNDGMVVKSDSSEHVAQARSAVQELLLLNHPVDCPICDQAGECDLQDYWLQHQRKPKRMMQEPVHKPKAVVFGETIVYDAERCIMCTRCIRVCDEVAQDPVLDMRERGNRNEIIVSPGRELDHDYTLMTEHVCPVGALTSSHFRFKARVWFLRSGRTVCQGCSTGCSAYLDHDPRTNTAYRYRPRDNEEVNGYWMCDEGMLSYTEAHENRLLQAHVGGDDATVREALRAAKTQLAGHDDEPDKVAVVLSAQHSVEDNYALLTLAKEFIGTSQVYVTRRPDGRGDDILMSEDKNSNTRGVADLVSLLGFEKEKPVGDLVAALEAGDVRYVIALGSEVDLGDDGDAPKALKSALATAKATIAMCSHDGPLAHAAHIALPACSWAEAPGTYVNKDGVRQRTDAVLEPMGETYPAWEMIVALGRTMGYAFEWNDRTDLLSALDSAMRAAQAAGDDDEGGAEAAPKEVSP